MSPDVSAVVVSHRSSREARDCVASLSAAFRAEGVRGEIVLVDCGSGAAEAAELATAGADVFLPLAENRGYAGGVNAGLAGASSSRILLCNSDVLFAAGSLAPLLEAVDDRSVGAAAPLAFWDAAGHVLLPAGWAPGFFSDLAQLSAGRRPARDAARFARFARQSLRLWEEGGFAPHLTGAVLAARRDVFDRVGRFDERFPFEYEETEWEDRVRARGLRLRLVPRSRVRHLWGASAAANPDVAARRAKSRRVYRTRRYGWLGRAILDRADRRRAGPGFPALSSPAFPAQSGAWLAISPNPSLLPFAAAPLDAGFSLPEEIVSRLDRTRLYFRVFRAVDGRSLETWAWEKK
ncbi:MAG: glycosyltransferase family 2 protein [Acidobacteriota bacterium]